jgi:uncharacterized protein YjbI with pentapeptide repeats
MARSRPSPAAIGATQAPDLVLDRLEQVELTRLDGEFELEAVQLGPADLSELDAPSGRIEQARLEDLDLDGAKLRGLRLVDVSGARVSAANGNWGGASLRRVALKQARLTGLDLAEARLDEVRFVGCKLDYANFRHTTIEHVSFEDCVLSGADFQGARLYSARFAGCDLSGADFSRAELAHVDLRGSQLELAGSVLGLGGATIDPLQLMELSRLLADELGLIIAEE